jgi:hypothetical protein
LRKIAAEEDVANRTRGVVKSDKATRDTISLAKRWASPSLAASEQGMNVITGTVKNGLIVLDEPADLRDGSRVVVQPVETVESFGLSESDWRDTPEAIADWIDWYDSLEPIELSAADDQALEAFRARQQEIGKSSFDATPTCRH